MLRCAIFVPLGLTDTTTSPIALLLVVCRILRFPERVPEFYFRNVNEELSSGVNEESFILESMRNHLREDFCLSFAKLSLIFQCTLLRVNEKVFRKLYQTILNFRS